MALKIASLIQLRIICRNWRDETGKANATDRASKGLVRPFALLSPEELSLVRGVRALRNGLRCVPVAPEGGRCVSVRSLDSRSIICRSHWCQRQAPQPTISQFSESPIPLRDIQKDFFDKTRRDSYRVSQVSDSAETYSLSWLEKEPWPRAMGTATTLPVSSSALAHDSWLGRQSKSVNSRSRGSRPPPITDRRFSKARPTGAPNSSLLQNPDSCLRNCGPAGLQATPSPISHVPGSARP